MKEKMNKYHAWKAKQGSCEPIEGTERIFVSPSKRFVEILLAEEEGVELSPYGLPYLNDGTFWAITFAGKA